MRSATRARRGSRTSACASGLQCAVIEFARNVCGLEDANSSEFDPATPHPVIDLLPEQKNVTDLGGSMRLGAQPCHVVPGTDAADVYGGRPSSTNATAIATRSTRRTTRRCRARGSCSRACRPDGRLVEIVELEGHPFFMAGQFHPELKSRPTRPHPLFRDFIGAVRRRAEREVLSAPERQVVLPG